MGNRSFENIKSNTIDKKSRVKLTTIQLVAMGFLGVILLGALILWLPVCNREPIAFIDALFMAVTCVCVTGLVTVTPAVQFTLAGKIVILILIQIGGLGVIACTSAFFLILRKRISMSGRIVIQQAYGLDTLSGMVKFMIRILRGTFFVEGIGMALYTIRFVPKYGVVRGLWYSLFHAVSAFCNAGVDILGDSSLSLYVTDPLINFTTIFLISTAGVGFPVLHDIYENGKKVLGEKLPAKRLVTRLSLQSKIVLSMSSVLLLLGTVGFFLMEFHNPDTMEGLTIPQKLMASFFQTVTTRTAGFAALHQASLTPISRLLSCMLMFVGGSPAGTAGGIKTTTAALLALTVLSVLKGRRSTECFGCRVSRGQVRMALTITLLTFFFWVGGVSALTVLEPGQDFLNLMFEAMSAVATVGLTADLTPLLSQESHVVLMVLMYIGRIGPMTMALLLTGRPERASKFRELPEKKVMIG